MGLKKAANGVLGNLPLEITIIQHAKNIEGEDGSITKLVDLPAHLPQASRHVSDSMPIPRALSC